MSLNLWYFLISQNTSTFADLKGPKEIYNLHCGGYTGPPYGSTPVAVTTNTNIKMSSENIQNKENGPERSVLNNKFSSVTLN